MMKTFLVLLVLFLLILHIGREGNVAGQKKTKKCVNIFCVTVRNGSYLSNCNMFRYPWSKGKCKQIFFCECKIDLARTVENMVEKS
ncbi:unnamed protein product [Clavelina lepadiformis]|uniref:Uncharacterized protein n=1 Tax=Clavelina lepadiformis TaxID=159417 RepID=A0ABP0FZS6_CLALP